MFHGALFSSGGNPVLGNIGMVTTTVASAKSLAVRPLAVPSAVPVLTVVWKSLDWQVKLQASLLSSRLFLFKSPGCPATRPGNPVHLSSEILTLLNGAVPGLVTVYV